jgi:hypothetical protein
MTAGNADDAAGDGAPALADKDDNDDDEEDAADAADDAADEEDAEEVDEAVGDNRAGDGSETELRGCC